MEPITTKVTLRDGMLVTNPEQFTDEKEYDIELLGIPRPPNIQTLKQGKSIMVDILMAQVRPFIKYFEYSYTMSDKNQEIEKNVSEQAGIEGQRKEVNVEDYPKAVALGQLLKDIDFPADKQKVIQHVEQRSGSNADSQNILSTLQNIEDKEYHNVAEVTKAAGVVYT